MKPGYAEPGHQNTLKETRRLLTTSLNSKDLKSLAVGKTVRMIPIRARERVWKEAVVTKTLPDRSHEVEDANGHQY